MAALPTNAAERFSGGPSVLAALPNALTVGASQGARSFTSDRPMSVSADIPREIIPGPAGDAFWVVPPGLAPDAGEPGRVGVISSNDRRFFGASASGAISS